MLWAAAGTLTFWSLGFKIVEGTDTWWQLAAGRWTIDHRALPLTDPFSFSRAGAPWLHHEWLSSVLLQLWTRAAGVPSLAFLKWTLIAVTYLLLFRVLVRAGRPAFAAYLASTFAAALAAPFLDIRPHLFSLIGYVLVLGFGLRAKVLPWALPILFVIWSNLHGGFFFGVAVLAMMVIFRAWSRPEAAPADLRRRAVRREFLIVALSAAASLANPNGISAFLYPLKYAFDSRSPFRQILEWLPPFRPGGIAAPLFVPAIFVLLVSAAATGSRLRHAGPERLVVAAGLGLSAVTLAMALQSRRFIPLFGIAEALLLSLAVERIGGALAGMIGDRAFRLPVLRTGFIAPVVALAVGLIRLSACPASPRAFSHLVDEEFFPVDTMSALEAAQVQGNVFAHYDWGGYVIFRSNGRLRVFVDSRADTVYDDATFRKYLAVLNHEEGWQRVIESSGAEFVLWPRSDKVVSRVLVESGRWRLLYQDSAGNLLERSDGREVRLEVPDSASRRVLLAENAAARGDFSEAERQARVALAMDPELTGPCQMLARLEALRGAVIDARETEAGCQRVFPQPRQRAAFEQYLERLAG